MLAFIHKHLPSKDQTSNHQILQDDEHIIEKQKNQTLSTINRLVMCPSINPVNRSYSDTDYFPMISGGLAEIIHNEKLWNHSDTSQDKS
ncbi:unnamed protein product [Adineta steineri]|uniref:Uncharacterized protein n=1 Tax=Adineta steineri TaxID=433720 RepID=A0A818JZY9_9BILA|nr:unnamed protein product [Adineta steineri]